METFWVFLGEFGDSRIQTSGTESWNHLLKIRISRIQLQA